MFEVLSKFICRHKGRRTPFKNIFDILRFINIVTYIAGFRIFEYPAGHLRPRLSYLYSALLFSLYYAGWYYQGYMLETEATKILNFQGAMYKLTTTIDQSAMFVIIFMGCFHSKSLKLSVQRIHEVHVTLRTLGTTGSFNIIYKRTIQMITYILINMTVFTGLYIYVYEFIYPFKYSQCKVICSVFIQLYNQIVEYMLIFEFFTIISVIHSEFQQANDLLADINLLPFSSIAIELHNHKNSKDPFSTNKSSSETSTKLFTILPSSRRLRSNLQMTSHEIIRSRRLLQTIRQVHLELFRVSKRISMIYGIPISMEMCLCILFTTYSLYSLYDAYQQDTNTDIVLILSTTGTVILCFNNWMKMISINYICGKAAQQAQRTNEIIYTFYGQNTDCELQEEMEMFSLQLMHCRLKFSADGLYALNCKNLCACAGFITTYVVIMIQVTGSVNEEI